MPRDVDYTLEIFDDLPEPPPRSDLEKNLTKIRAEPRAHGRMVRIGDYGKRESAESAKNGMHRKHGNSPEIEGYRFRVARADRDDEPRFGLFVCYTPEAIVPGAQGQWREEIQRRDEKARLKAEKEAQTV